MMKYAMMMLTTGVRDKRNQHNQVKSNRKTKDNRLVDTRYQEQQRPYRSLMRLNCRTEASQLAEREPPLKVAKKV